MPNIVNDNMARTSNFPKNLETAGNVTGALS
jgi:hypothetical protein